MIKSVPSFIKRWESKRRKVKRKKERKASHHRSSHEVLYVCPPPPGVVEDAGGCVLLAVMLTMPFMPYGGPFQLGQELLPGRECPLSWAVHAILAMLLPSA